MTRERKQDLLVGQWLILVFVAFWTFSVAGALKIVGFGLLLTGCELVVNRFQRDWKRPPLGKLLTCGFIGLSVGGAFAWGLSYQLETADTALVWAGMATVVAVVAAGHQPKDRR